MKIIELKLMQDNKGEGITAISLVRNPAIEQNWIAFSAQGEMFTRDSVLALDKKYAFQTIDEDQRIIAGPAMIPDKLIYRIDEDGEESFVFFKAETIQELSERFLLQGKQNNMTLEHDATLNDLSVVESWIVEHSEQDKSAVYGYDLPVGSWFVKVKVLNDDVWNLVKEKQVAGFSVEGVFARELIENSKPMKKTKLDDYLDKIKTLFADDKPEDIPEEKFGSIEATNADGQNVTINFPGEILEVGALVTHTMDGEELPLPTGEWTLADGGILIVTEEGVVAEITAEEPPEEELKKEDDEVDTEKIMEALVDGIADVLSQFKTQVTDQVATSIQEATDTLREEFNKPAVKKPKPETPETEEKDKLVVGLGKFVRDAKESK